jgi:uncharacterized protein YjbI with pentapeptide repeats
MRQLSTQNLQELLINTTERPLVIEDSRITGSLKKTQLHNINFNNCHFFNLDVSSSTFAECKFSECKFTHSNFYHTQFTGCNIHDTTLFNTEFHASLISTSKISNTISSKVLFKQSSLQYTKFICNSLIATTFTASSFLDAFFEYNTLDASTFEKCGIYNSVFRSSNMRGVEITGSTFENTSMDFINFDDILNINPSEFFIPAKFTNIRSNTNVGLAITNSNLKKAFKDFGQSAKSPIKKPKTFNIPTPKIEFSLWKFFKNKERTVKQNKASAMQSEACHQKEASHIHERPKKHFLPHNLNARNVGSVTTFVIQAVLTLTIVLMFGKFYNIIDGVFYKSVPNIVEFPIGFISSSIEMHKFAFYFSLLYFSFSGILLCLNVVCIRGIRNLLLTWMYRLQSITTLCVLAWLWKENIAMQSMFISFFNLLFAFYFFIMFVQSFNTTNKNEPQTA